MLIAIRDDLLILELVDRLIDPQLLEDCIEFFLF